jgi:hypothetical protein
MLKNLEATPAKVKEMTDQSFMHTPQYREDARSMELQMNEHRDYWFRSCLYAVVCGDEQEAFRAAFILVKLHRPEFNIERPADYAAWFAPKKWVS